MRFNKHFDLEGRHAYLTPSKPAWMGYDDDKFDRVYKSDQARARGDRLHMLAALLITERVKVEDVPLTFNMYVNDSIGWRLTSEQKLYYSDNAFGTADAIGLTGTKLRVSDLKSGVHAASPDQLEGYAALFCLEYGRKPFELEIELRIYQNDEVRLYVADPVKISIIMEQIEYLDKRIQYLREEDAK